MIINSQPDSDAPHVDEVPLVSVIIPSFNHAQYIEKAIQSVLEQTYGNIELIIVDDGSQDDSHSVIKRYSEIRRIHMILSQKNRGQSAALKQGLALSKGEFVCFLPSDDWFLPHKIELQVAKFLICDHQVGVVYGAGQRFFEDTGVTIADKRPVFTGWVAEELVGNGNFVVPATPMFRREVFNKIELSDRFKAEGEAVYFRIALHYKFEYVEQFVAVMRAHTYNIGANAEVMYQELMLFWDWYFNLPEVPDHIKRLRPKTLEVLHRVKGMQFLGNRNYAVARTCFLRALRFKPSHLTSPRFLAALAVTCMPKTISEPIVDRFKGRRAVHEANRSRRHSA